MRVHFAHLLSQALPVTWTTKGQTQPKQLLSTTLLYIFREAKGEKGFFNPSLYRLSYPNSKSREQDSNLRLMGEVSLFYGTP